MIQPTANQPSSSALPSSRRWWRLAVVFISFCICVAGFAALADEVREGEPLPFDAPLLQGSHAIAAPALDMVAVAATALGEAEVVAVATAVGCAIMYYYHRRRQAVLLAVTVGGAAALNVLLKLLFVRERPDIFPAIITETSFSFPSGHTMGSSALAAALIIIFWPTRWRWLVVGAMGLYALLVGASRVYLGVHFPSDVLAGWFMSLAWAALAWVLLYQLPFSKR